MILHILSHPIMKVKCFGPLDKVDWLKSNERIALALRGNEAVWNLCATACAFVPWKENELTCPPLALSIGIMLCLGR